MVWGLGVGYVISGNYFGWNLGLAEGGTLGLAVATGFAIVMYTAFTFSYAELACSIPKAGGAFDYVTRALGDHAGFITGLAQNVEFIFAPPAIAFAIGSYLHLFIPAIPPLWFSVGAYGVFTALNIYGVQAAARFELAVTIVAVAGLILYSAVVLPGVQWSNLVLNPLPRGAEGIFASIPFAIWFFLGIEGIANLAEEAVDPRHTMYRGFLSALATLIVLCGFTFVASVGTAGWEKVVLLPDGTASDSPLPMAMAMVVGEGHWVYQALIGVGLFGLIASFNGLMLAAGRSNYEFGKTAFAPAFLGRISSRFRTPMNALVFNMVVGLLALLSGRTGELITISVFGALTLYIFSMIAVVVLRRKEPQLPRPFQVHPFPLIPLLALTIAGVALTAMAIHQVTLFTWYALFLAGCFGIFKARKLWLQEKR